MKRRGRSHLGRISFSMIALDRKDLTSALGKVGYIFTLVLCTSSKSLEESSESISLLLHPSLRVLSLYYEPSLISVWWIRYKGPIKIAAIKV